VSIGGAGRALVTWGRQVQGSGTAPAYNQLWDLRNAAKPLPARSPAPGELGSIPAVFSLDMAGFPPPPTGRYPMAARVAVACGLVLLGLWTLHGFLPALSRKLLGQELALPSLPTWWSGESAAWRDVRDELYASLLGKSMTFHGRQPVGDTMARATNDVRELNLMFNPGLNLVIGSGFFLVMPAAFGYAIPPQLAVVPTLFVLAYSVALRRYLRRIDRLDTFAGRATQRDLPTIESLQREAELEPGGKQREVVRKNEPYADHQIHSLGSQEPQAGLPVRPLSRFNKPHPCAQLALRTLSAQKGAVVERLVSATAYIKNDS